MTHSTGQIINNRYRVVKLLGQGGFGAVYRAWDMNLERPCALKENLETSPEAQQQFYTEAKILANLSHPSLPRVTDHFVIPGQGQYLAMDFVEGEDLSEILEVRPGGLPEAQALPWILQVAEALAYMHSQNPPVIHRDIKPANIKITSLGKAMLVDFGIAKLYGPSLKTMMGARAVTPGYSPPEQYGQGITDARSDVYALGAMLYHLLTGQHPPESILRNLKTPMPAPRSLNPAISARTEQAILRAMELQPGNRFQSAAEFKTALEARTDTPARAPRQPTPAAEYTPPTLMVHTPASAAAGKGAAFPATVAMKPPQAAAAPKAAPRRNSCVTVLVVLLVIGIAIFLCLGLGGALLDSLIPSLLTTPAATQAPVATTRAAPGAATPWPSQTPIPPAAGIRQWASSASASSQYGEVDWSANMATFEPDTFECGDHTTAWASATTGSNDWLEVRYRQPVIASQVNIHQTYNPSQVVKVELLGQDGGSVVIYQAQPASVEQCPYILSIPVSGVGMPVVGVRLSVDQSILDLGWNEIDAVELVGAPSGTENSRAWLGMWSRTLESVVAQQMNLPADQKGVYVSAVARDGPAELAGLIGSIETVEVDGTTYYIGGDIIIALDDQTIESQEQLSAFTRGAAPGQVVRMTVLRGGERITLQITLGHWPMDIPTPTAAP